jgi:predicted nucleic acid-binding protein
MGQGFLIDTNIVIATLGNKLPSDGAAFIKTIPPNISIITQIELLGWHGVTATDLSLLTDFVNKANIFSLDPPIVQQTIMLRQYHKIKTPDAIIAATALIHGLTLVSRNVSDFKQITQLQVINPFELTTT